SLEEKMLELPDYEHLEDETFPPFPPPASPGREDGEGAEPDEERRAPVPVPPKRTIKRNIPKLDAQRLISERGLPALRHVFDKAKFKGKGHEAEDLKKLIRHMEHWAHRLFPKLQFEDFIDRVEQLGNKKEVQQTCLKRIRLDLPILHEDFVNNNDEVGENNEDDVTAAELDPFVTNSPERGKFASESSRSLTEEQQQRIERNKQLALERRQAKLLTNSQSLGNDLDSPRAQTAGEVNTSEDQKEEESNGLNVDILENPHDAENTVNVKEELKREETQLDQS
uniref:TIMELESS-interacting protein n=1 Tax=Loxodonta africana TaxID=9785 RepID=G3TYT5_LOXAF